MVLANPHVRSNALAMPKSPRRILPSDIKKMFDALMSTKEGRWSWRILMDVLAYRDGERAFYAYNGERWRAER